MQQVNRKKIRIKYFFSFLLIIFFIFGCSSKSEYTSTTRSFDNNITKDQLLHAVKRVFTITDKDAFLIDSYRNELNITKPKASYKLYTMDMQNDNFYFKVDDNATKKTTEATISISRTYGIEEEDRYYLDENSFTYQLFWDRVEYLLGLKKDWKLCNYLISDGFMCDIVDLDNSWFSDKKLIDLNTTISDRNITKETIKFSTAYKTPQTNPTLVKEKQQELYLEYNNANKTPIKESKGQISEEKDNFIKSFKLPVEENVDTNSSIKVKKKADYLDDKKIQEINLDNNSTNG
jgi:hypothetical protein